MKTIAKIRLLVGLAILLYFAFTYIQHRIFKSKTGNDLATSQENPTVGGKLDAYVKANNRLVKWEHFPQWIDDYKQSNPDLANPKAKIKDLSLPWGGDLDSDIEDLKKAASINIAVPEIDPAAKNLLAALEILSPMQKELNTYQKTREFVTDGGAKARQMTPQLLATIDKADTTQTAFGDAIHLYKFKRDETRLATLKQDSLEYLTLNNSINSRKLFDTIESRSPRAADVDVNINALTASNTALGEFKVPASDSPKWDAGCKTYKSAMDEVIGEARTVSEALKSGKDIHAHSGRGVLAEDSLNHEYVDKFNKAVDQLNSCN